jgi:hypothetical protein
MQPTFAGSSTAGSERKRIGALTGLGGALLMIGGSFVTWIESFGTGFSGWDLYDSQNDVGKFPFMIDETFRSTFDPFFTGGTTVALGLVLAGLAIAVLLAPERPAGTTRTRVHPALYVAVVLAVVAAFLVAAINLRTYFGRPDGVDVSLAVGFWIPVVGIALAAFGLTSAAGRTRRELAAARQGPPVPPRAAPAPAPAPPLTAPGWYPDPAHRHQVRYWDGTAWTSHVGDAGAQSDDPVPIG